MELRQNSGVTAASIVHKLIPQVFGIWIFLAALFLSAGPSVADFNLEPGDEVRVSLTGLDDLSFEATVDVHGDLNLNWLGALQSARAFVRRTRATGSARRCRKDR